MIKLLKTIIKMIVQRRLAPQDTRTRQRCPLLFLFLLLLLSSLLLLLKMIVHRRLAYAIAAALTSVFHYCRQAIMINIFSKIILLLLLLLLLLY